MCQKYGLVQVFPIITDHLINNKIIKLFSDQRIKLDLKNKIGLDPLDHKHNKCSHYNVLFSGNPDDIGLLCYFAFPKHDCPKY